MIFCPFAGTTSWNTGASITFLLSKDETGICLELIYSKTIKEKKESFNYKVRIVSVPSNLGKGNNYYFTCPISGKRCKILYMAYGSNYFKCRNAYQNRIYYLCQLSSRLNLNNDIYWRVERQLKTLYPKPDKPELNRKTFNFPILWNHLLKDIAKKSAAYLVVTTA